MKNKINKKYKLLDVPLKAMEKGVFDIPIAFKELYENKPLYILGKRANAMPLFEAFCDMEVTYRDNEKLIFKIKQGNIKAIQILKGVMLKNGDRLIHPEHIDYFLCLKLNKILSTSREKKE